jgi:hypothetical protein
MARKSGFSATTTTSFPTVGSYDHVMNMSGQRSPYTIPEARKGPTTPDMGGGNGSARRSPSVIRNAQGPTLRPVATRGFAPEYPETGRAFRTVPSAIGVRGFWQSRAESNDGQVIG